MSWGLFCDPSGNKFGPFSKTGGANPGQPGSFKRTVWKIGGPSVGAPLGPKNGPFRKSLFEVCLRSGPPLGTVSGLPAGPFRKWRGPPLGPNPGLRPGRLANVAVLGQNDSEKAETLAKCFQEKFTFADSAIFEDFGHDDHPIFENGFL